MHRGARTAGALLLIGDDLHVELQPGLSSILPTLTVFSISLMPFEHDEVASKQVFKRKTDSSKYDGRLPIYKLTAPSVWGIVVKNNIDKRIRRAAKYRLEFQMNQKAEELVRRFGKG